MKRARGYLGAMTAMLSTAVAGDPASVLHKDPFERPPEKLAEAGIAAEEPLLPPWQGRLTMTVRAGERSLVNVDGKIVPLGGDFRGFRLVAVGERSAVFTRGEQRVEVSLDEEPSALAHTATDEHTVY